MELLSPTFHDTLHAFHEFAGIGWNSKPQLSTMLPMQFTSLHVSDETLDSAINNTSHATHKFKGVIWSSDLNR